MRLSRSLSRPGTLVGVLLVLTACTSTSTAGPAGWVPQLPTPTTPPLTVDLSALVRPVTDPSLGVRLLSTSGVGAGTRRLATGQQGATTVSLRLRCSSGTFSVSSGGRMVFQGTCHPGHESSGTVSAGEVHGQSLAVRVQAQVIWFLDAWQE